MTTVFLAWRDCQSGRWFPVGRLDCRSRDNGDQSKYEFLYVNGAKQASRMAWILKIPGFPKLSGRYRSSTLFPMFRNRVMNLKRPDRPGYLAQLGLNGDSWDAIAELSISGGRSHADNFEIFPEILPDSDGRFTTSFIMDGLKDADKRSIERSESLEVGERLEFALALDNSVATQAISVKTPDNHVLGALPRYLVDGLCLGGAWMIKDAEARVERVSLDLPLSHRLLVCLSGRLPAGFKPMSDLEQYKPIAASDSDGR